MARILFLIVFVVAVNGFRQNPKFPKFDDKKGEKGDLKKVDSPLTLKESFNLNPLKDHLNLQIRIRLIFMIYRNFKSFLNLLFII